MIALSTKNIANLVILLFICITYFWQEISGTSSWTLSATFIFFSITILFLNWTFTSHGRHLSFIFIAFFLIFLGGRTFPILVGAPTLIDRIGFSQEYDLPTWVVQKYIWCAIASIFTIHAISSTQETTPIPQNIFNPENSAAVKYYWWVYAMTIGGLVWKNVIYFKYLMDNGGYLAIYQGTEHIQNAGIIPRALSLIALCAFVLYFFSETNKNKSIINLSFFSILFASELLVGLRGKYFVIIITLLFFHQLKFGGRFNLRGMAVASIAIIGLSLLVEFTREQKDGVEWSKSIANFFSTQGVSAGVLEVVIENEDYFSHHGISYLLHQFIAPFITQSSVPSGWFLANDVSMLVMLEAYKLGFGTGSSYIAELYVIGSMSAVITGSIVIAILLNIFTKYRSGVLGAFTFWVASGIAYYPRTMLHEPIHNLIKYTLPTLMLYFTAEMLARIINKNKEN